MKKFNNSILADREYSTHPKAVASREKYRNDPSRPDNAAASNRRWAGKKVAKRTQSISSDRLRLFRPESAMGRRIALHLSKGRDAGDIAVRERLSVSAVNQMIEAVQAFDKAQS